MLAMCERQIYAEQDLNFDLALHIDLAQVAALERIFPGRHNGATHNGAPLPD